MRVINLYIEIKKYGWKTFWRVLAAWIIQLRKRPMYCSNPATEICTRERMTKIWRVLAAWIIQLRKRPMYCSNPATETCTRETIFKIFSKDTDEKHFVGFLPLGLSNFGSVPCIASIPPQNHVQGKQSLKIFGTYGWQTFWRVLAAWLASQQLLQSRHSINMYKENNRSKYLAKKRMTNNLTGSCLLASVPTIAPIPAQHQHVQGKQSFKIFGKITDDKHFEGFLPLG